MNLPYTMPPNEAAALRQDLHAEDRLPVSHMGSDLKVFEDARKGSGVEVRVRDWYAKS